MRELFVSEWAAGSQWGSSTQLLLEIRRKCERNEAHAAVLAPLLPAQTEVDASDPYDLL